MNSTQEAISLVQSGARNFFDDCYHFAERWVIGKDNFTSEDLIHDFRQLHNFFPAEVRVFGAVMRKLQNDGLIKKVGIGSYKAPQGHSKPCNVWSSI